MLTERWDWGQQVVLEMLCTWWLLWLAIKKAFVGTGQAISLHLCTNGLRKYPSYLVRAGTKYFFSDERHPDYSRYTNHGLD